MTKLIVAFCDFARTPLASQLMLCREVIAVRSEIYRYNINVSALCGLNVEFLDFKPGGT
jgi:hypothetical protein